MGLRLEVYNENFVGLIADFNFVTDSKEFCSSNNIDDAIAYFDLYLDPRTNRLKRNDPNQKVVDKLAIDINSIDDFQEQLEAVTDTLTDADALKYNLLFEEWNKAASYDTDDRVRHYGVLYKCLQGHTAQQDWAPSAAPSLWAEVLLDPSISGPQDWQQPGANNGYAQGDQVIHNGKVWESQVSNNVWEPGTVGTEALWTEVVI